MMFLEYMSLGMWGATIYTYITENTDTQGSGIFSPGFAGYCAVSGSIGSLISPVLFGMLSDRFVSAQRLLSLSHLGCAISAWCMFQSNSQATFFLWIIAFFQCFVPTIALTNKIALRHLANRDIEFARCRALGTAGWVFAGLLVGFVWPEFIGTKIENTRIPLLLGACGNLVMVFYALTLPASPPEGKNQSSEHETQPDKTRLLRNQPFLFFLFVSLLASIPFMAYTVAMNPFLNQQGYPWPATILCLGQISEVAFMWAMPWFVARYSLKRLFLIGLFSWGLRYFALAAAHAYGWSWAAYLAIAIHGPCYVYIFVAGQLYVDRITRPENRGTAQGYHTLATIGIGSLIGSLATGYAQEVYLTPEGVSPTYRWTEFWFIPGVVAILVALFFKLGYKPSPSEEGENQEVKQD